MAVVPSIGALVPGWTLLLHRDHATSSTRLEPEKFRSLHQAAEDLRGSLATVTGLQTAIFEHGASSADSATACTTAHVHLHVVPLGFDLIDAADALQPLARPWLAVHSPDELPKLGDGDYLYTSPAPGRHVVNPLATPVSQYFRRVIADVVGHEDEWNWRTHPQPVNYAATWQMLRGSRLAPAA